MITDSIFQNNTLYYGYFKILPYIMYYGTFLINNCTFVNNKSIYGTIFNVESDVYSLNQIKVSNSTFDNNYAKEYGGVIYSNSKYVNKMLTFTDCKFINNNAGNKGNFMMILNKESLPIFKFNNKYLKDLFENLSNEKKNFATNPSSIACAKVNEKISIFSGETPLEKFEYNLYDDYDNQFILDSNIDSYTINDLFYLSVNLRDENGDFTEDAMIYGSNNGYCWSNTCYIGNFKVIGNEGNYILLIKFESFGKYQPFKQNEITFNIEIKNCNQSIYLYKDNLNIGRNICYLPKCFQNCNTGKCLNDDLCDCRDTIFTGKYCNEYYHHKKKLFLYIIYNSLTFLLLALSVVSIYLINVNKKYDIIKAGSIDLSYIILTGTIITYLSVIFQINSRGTLECLLSVIFKQIGFTLSFGTVFLKNFRIYKIFLNDILYETILTRKKIYIYLCLLLCMDIAFLIFWIENDNIGFNKSLNDKNQQYSSCNILNTEFFG